MSKKVLIPIVIIILAIIAGGTVFFVVNANSPEKKLSRQLDLGAKYLSEEAYEQAIVAFDVAISIDPKNVDAYLGKAEAYMGLGDYESAIDALLAGYNETEDKQLKKELQKVAEDYVEELMDDGDIGEAVEIIEDIQDELGEDFFEGKLDNIIGNNNNGVMQAYYDTLSSLPAATMDDYDFYDASFSPDDSNAKYGPHVEYATVRDLNGDEVPELICMTLYNFRWEDIIIYSYIDGMAVVIGELDNCHTAAGSYYAYFCEDGHIHNCWSGATPMGDDVVEETVYIFDGSRLVETNCNKGMTNDASDDLYQMNGNSEEYRNSLLQ